MRPMNAGETDLARVNDETVGLLNDLLRRRTGLGDLSTIIHE